MKLILMLVAVIALMYAAVSVKVEDYRSENEKALKWTVECRTNGGIPVRTADGKPECLKGGAQ